MTQQLENMPITEIEIAYGGEAYADNQIDAKTLGEALMNPLMIFIKIIKLR
ncbi:hypothetical protein [Escherichia coli]|uniref:hypothetical protein n=1 Tax=Escherichia coli TaxID=562 RepID=UPI001419C29C|nr:hypothetical protein [Escherichia coli]